MYDLFSFNYYYYIDFCWPLLSLKSIFFVCQRLFKRIRKMIWLVWRLMKVETCVVSQTKPKIFWRKVGLNLIFQLPGDLPPPPLLSLVWEGRRGVVSLKNKGDIIEIHGAIVHLFTEGVVAIHALVRKRYFRLVFKLSDWFFLTYFPSEWL